MTEISIIFTGQGSQKVGMAQDFVEKLPEAKRLFEEASNAIGIDLIEVCSKEDGRLDQTEYSQPALLTAETVIYLETKKQLAQTPKYFAGHSLGEYTALVAAGVLPFVDAVKIVRKRGQLMQNAMPGGGGAMAALVMDNIDKSEYKNLVLEQKAEVANYNSPNQVVISGAKEAVENASKKLAEKYPEMRVVPLNVSAAFHSSLMKGIEAEFQEYVLTFSSGFNLEKGKNVLSNFTGKFHQPDSLIENLVKQISGSVCWTENMEVLKQVCTEAIEIGPARVLSKLCSTVGLSAKTISDLRSLQKNLPLASTN